MLDLLKDIVSMRMFFPILIFGIVAIIVISHYIKVAVSKIKSSHKKAIVKKRLAKQSHRPVKLTKK